uniref:DNA 5'-3' helicase n=1 Tax=Gastroclonium compressum TaxID=1852973 RepID=A0A173G0A3_GASCM|nr:putative replicative DNA helicase [Coeloseira compressa]ANH09697.1 putative replicative DNA helicase [Coeloseira compressa]
MNNLYLYPIPPQNYLSEQLLIGIILINPTILPNITPLINRECFFLESHKIIYDNLIELYKLNSLYPIQILEYLSDKENLYQIGGIEKILDLMKQSQIFTIYLNINKYSEQLISSINNQYSKRLLIQYAYNIIQLAYIKQFPSYQIYNKASQYLDYTSQNIPKNSIINFQELISQFLLTLKIQKENTKIISDAKQQYCKFKSGFLKLDQLIQGISQGDLIIIAGRPSMGKTSFAINILYNIIIELNAGISVFSLEMTKQQILIKLIAIITQSNTQKIQQKNLTDVESKYIIKKCKKIIGSNIYLNDTTNISIEYIEYTAKLLYKETQYVEIIMIDYLQLIQVEECSYSNRPQELSYITRKLKLLAQNLFIPIIVLSQLNRGIEHRTNKKPMLSDLRESGCLNISSFLKLTSNTLKELHLKNLYYIKKYFHLQKINCYCQKDKINNYLNFIQKLYIHINYIYPIYIKNKIIPTVEITNKHKIHLKHKWFRISLLLDINTIYQNFNHKSKNNLEHNVLENIYINKIFIKQKNIIYDLHVTNNLFYSYQNICMHNSIEQDADIVMILYKTEINENNTLSDNIVDIIVCKNRNGPIGSLQLAFKAETATFNKIK